jgi:hypothetical protein
MTDPSSTVSKHKQCVLGNMHAMTSYLVVKHLAYINHRRVPPKQISSIISGSLSTQQNNTHSL